MHGFIIGSWICPLAVSLLALLVCLGLSSSSAYGATDDAPIGLDSLYRLDKLPSFKQSVKVGSFSSYDRTGGNDDGFSGKHSFLREVPEGKVVAEMEGPGVIYRIWSANPTDDIVDFYLDGEKTPRLSIKFRDMFDGDKYPFISPLAGRGVGGYYSYAPIPFAKSCLVIVRGGFKFYQMNYAIYPKGTPIRTFEPEPGAEDLARLEKARQLFTAAGTDISKISAPAGSTLEVTGRGVTVAPGKTKTLFETDKPGRIVGLKLSPATVFAGKDRELLLRFTWDGENGGSFVCPVGDFFGYSWGEPATASLLIGTARDGVNYCYFPMPFDKSAKIEVVSTRQSGMPTSFYAEVITAAVPKAANEGRFYAVWRRENPTTEGRPFTFVKAEGRGHLVGNVLQAQGNPYNMGFFEGDDQTTIDGELAIHGTGSEDFFSGGWYDVPGCWDTRRSLPLSGCIEYEMYRGRTGGYRLMLGDAYAFNKSLYHVIEHDAEGNKYITDYVGVSYLYADKKPFGATDVPSTEALAIREHNSVAFRGNKLLLNMVDGKNAVIKKDGANGHVSFTAEAGRPYISFICDIPLDGDYEVSMDGFKGPDKARVQLEQHATLVGEPVDLYSETREEAKNIELGTLSLREGENKVLIRLVGKNDKSSGLGFEVITLKFIRVE